MNTDYVFDLPKTETKVSTKQQVTPAPTSELTLDQIMQQQEKEAKKHAADKKRKEIEKKNNDPLALNYI